MNKSYCGIHGVELANGKCGHCEDNDNRRMRAGAELLDAILQSQGYVPDVPAWAADKSGSAT